jgi:predicted house-cleaning noncanonical NTP pyrophosphatase (MazG superfamily)
MPRFKLNKLVRDKIVEHQLASGAKPHYHKLDPETLKIELVNKIIEEAREVSAAEPAQVAAEIADIQQAVDDLMAEFSLTKDEIKQAQQNKKNRNGGFKQGHYVSYVDIDEDNQWTEYYRTNYLEIDSTLSIKKQDLKK